jgi:hypothetical protein
MAFLLLEPLAEVVLVEGGAEVAGLLGFGIESEAAVATTTAVAETSASETIAGTVATETGEVTAGTESSGSGALLATGGVAGTETAVGETEAGVGAGEAGVGAGEGGVGAEEAGVGAEEAGVGAEEAGVGAGEAGLGEGGILSYLSSLGGSAIMGLLWGVISASFIIIIVSFKKTLIHFIGQIKKLVVWFAGLFKIKQIKSHAKLINDSIEEKINNSTGEELKKRIVIGANKYITEMNKYNLENVYYKDFKYLETKESIMKIQEDFKGNLSGVESLLQNYEKNNICETEKYRLGLEWLKNENEIKDFRNSYKRKLLDGWCPTNKEDEELFLKMKFHEKHRLTLQLGLKDIGKISENIKTKVKSGKLIKRSTKTKKKGKHKKIKKTKKKISKKRTKKKMSKKIKNKKKKNNPCFPPKGKESKGLKYQNSKACIKTQIRDNPWMLEKGGEKIVGKGPLLNEIKRIKKLKKTKKKKGKKIRVRSGLNIWNKLKTGVKKGWEILKMPFKALSKIDLGTGIAYIITGLTVVLFSWANQYYHDHGILESGWDIFDPTKLGVDVGAAAIHGVYHYGVEVPVDYIIGDAECFGDWVLDSPVLDTLIVGGTVIGGSVVYKEVKEDIKKTKEEELENLKENLRNNRKKLTESDKKILEGLIDLYKKEINNIKPDEDVSDYEINREIEEGFMMKISEILYFIDQKTLKDKDYKKRKINNIMEYLKNTNKERNKINWLEIKKKYKETIYKFNIEDIREKLENGNN